MSPNNVILLAPFIIPLQLCIETAERYLRSIYPTTRLHLFNDGAV